MTKRFTVSLLAGAIAIAGFLAGMRTSAQDDTLPKPIAPLLMAGGESVQIAWTLPEGPKLETVIVYRTTDEAPRFVEVGRADASDLQLVDGDVRLGQTYHYRIQTASGNRQSGFSEQVSVTVGGSARIHFHGGSPERAVFEVVLFQRGQRVSQTFVHGPDQDIGDLAYVPELESVVDFRLGPKLISMELGRSAAEETLREPLKDGEGNPILGPDGKEILMEFGVPGSVHEILIATIRDKEGRARELKEGETWRLD